MCISLLSSRYFTVRFLGEYIYLGTKDSASIQSREIYDIFFQLPDDWDDAKLLCVSPHVVFSESGRTIRALGMPGDDYYGDNVVYNNGGGIDKVCTKSNFAVQVNCGGASSQLAPSDFHGELLTPSIRIPDELAVSETCKKLMRRAGTVFELRLGKLNKNVHYALRLEILPQKLLRVSPPLRRSRKWLEIFGIPSGHYSQAMGIYTPRTAYRNLVRFLTGVRQRSDFREAAETCLNVIQSSPIVIPLELHRIVVMGPPNAEVKPRELVGGAYLSDSLTVNSDGNQVAFYEWGSGAKIYWADEPEFLARQIYEHLREWAGKEPQKKGEITASLNAFHPNVSLVVDALAERGGLTRHDDRFSAVGFDGDHKEELESIFCQVATSVTDFRHMGYQILYTLDYEYLSPEELGRLWRLWLRNHTAFWATILALLLAFVSIAIGLLAL